MENLRALPLTCVRVWLSIAGADVCDIMESLSIPELFLREKSLSSISASGKIFHPMRSKEYSMLNPPASSTKDNIPSGIPVYRPVKGTNGLPAENKFLLHGTKQSLCPGMRLSVHFRHSGTRHMRVNLGSGQGSMAQQFLDRTEICPGLQNVRGECMPDLMGRNGKRNGRQLHIFIQHHLYGASA